MIWRYGVMGLGLLAALAGCQANETAGGQETTAEADDDAKAGDDFGEVGGGAGDSGSQLPDVGDFRDPRFGAGGLSR